MPRVSIILATIGRKWLINAIESVCCQTFEDWELLIEADGVDLSFLGDIEDGDKIKIIKHPDRRGKAARCQDGLLRARGEYVAYIDDDDIWYPWHLRALVDALDSNPEVSTVYSDLYRVQYLEHNGKRLPLCKRMLVSREFNRVHMMHFNHVMHVALMHRRQIAIDIGGYENCPQGLVDWFLTRRLAIVSYFLHVNVPTGEYYSHVKETDRISDKIREDQNEFEAIKRQIRSIHPPKPWKMPTVDVVAPIGPHIKDPEAFAMALIDSLDEYPCIFWFYTYGRKPSEAWRAIGQAARSDSVVVKHLKGSPDNSAVYRRHAKRPNVADYCLFVDDQFVPTRYWERIQVSIEYLENATGIDGVKFQFEPNTPYNLFMRPRRFLHWLKNRDGAKIAILGNLRSNALEYETLMNYHTHTGPHTPQVLEARHLIAGGTDQFMAEYIVRHCVTTGKMQTAYDLLQDLINAGYKVDNYLRIARLLHLQCKWDKAIQIYFLTLETIGIGPDDLEQIQIEVTGYLSSFECLCGLAECYMHLGDYDRAREFFGLAGRLKKSERIDSGLKEITVRSGQYDFKNWLGRDDLQKSVRVMLSDEGLVDSKNNTD